MIGRKFLHILAFTFFLLLLLAQTSCEKFSGDQTVPAYLKIDSIRLTTDYSTQGTAIHNITDVWVNIDGQLIGTFQLPATFPILQQGSHTLVVLPGVKQDGIASTRISYPFYQEIIKTINLVPDKKLDLGTLSTTYNTKTKFMWKEDFDDVAITLDTTEAATTKIKLTPSDSPLTLEGLHSAIVELDTVGATFACVSHSTFTIPNSAVFLEMNFNINASLIVGVYITTFGLIDEVPIMILNPTNDKWK
ncbi:MAG: hypothetical protein ABSE72_12395, partial [Bacteroidales bacterium]